MPISRIQRWRAPGAVVVAALIVALSRFAAGTVVPPDDIGSGIEPQRVGSIVSLATTYVRNLTYDLQHYNTSDGAWCLDVHVVADEDSGGACDFGVPASYSISVVSDSLRFGDDDFETLFYGPVATGVTSVKLRLGDGQVLANIPTLTNPAVPGVNFFIAGPVTGEVWSVEAWGYSALGIELAHRDTAAE